MTGGSRVVDVILTLGYLYSKSRVPKKFLATLVCFGTETKLGFVKYQAAPQEKTLFESTVLQPTQVNRYILPRRKDNHLEGTRQIDSVTLEKRGPSLL